MTRQMFSVSLSIGPCRWTVHVEYALGMGASLPEDCGYTDPRMAHLRRDVSCGLILVSAAAGCHAGALPGAPLDTSPSADASVAAPGRAQVQLTWRLFETMHSLDANGHARESAVFELLVNGGTPARVALGRRDSLGCTVHDAADETPGHSAVTSLECYANAHGEYARVERPTPGELRVEAFGQDEALPDREPPRTAVKTATVTVPADAEIFVEPGVLKIPDEAPAK